MQLQECRFRPRLTGAATREKLEDEVQGLLGAWTKNGQVWGDQVWGWKKDVLVATCCTPCGDSLDSTHASEWVTSSLERVRALCRSAPTFTVVGRRRGEVRAKSWRRQGELYLFTHMFDETSPLCGGRTGVPIPLYLVSISQELRLRLVAWMSTYEKLDSLWIGSGALEMHAYRELAKPDSAFSKHGRELAAKVEDATRMPTYYYLMRYWGRADKSGRVRRDELRRRCPGCGRMWNRKGPDGSGLQSYDYRCEPCRLISHEAVSFEDARHARIGEWRG